MTGILITLLTLSGVLNFGTIGALILILLGAWLICMVLDWLAGLAGIPGPIIQILKVIIVILAIIKVLALFGFAI